MIKKILLFVCLILALEAQSQTVKNSAEIIEFLGSDRYNDQLASNPGLIYFLDARVDFGFEIIDLVAEKQSDFANLDEIALNSKSGSPVMTIDEFLALHESGNLNILLFDFPVNPATNGYFKLGDSGKAIIIYSVQHVNAKIAQ